jgi:hypothetical protein
MPIDISIISAGADTTGFLPYIRNHIHSYQNALGNQRAPNPVEVEGVPQMVNAMLERCGRETHSIRAVRIFGHGVPGCQFIGCGNQEPEFDTQKLGLNRFRKTLYNLASLTLLRGYFAQGGNVVLHGCRVAEGSLGQIFLEKLSMLWQVSVAASEDRQINQLSGSQPFDPLHGRIRHVVFNLPGRAPVRGRGFSVSYSSVHEVPETPLHQ